jgi:uncharacterized protein YicC (UPF0701 family)
MSTVSIKLYEFARKEMHLTEDKAKEFVQAIDEVVKEDIKGEGINELATKSFVKDEIHRLELKVEQSKSELSKTIFWTGLIQFLAIVGSVISFISFMLKK